METDNELRAVAFRATMLMYTNEPCRICGVLIEEKDLHELVFAGYSADNRARSAHKECWDKQVPQEEWTHQ